MPLTGPQQLLLDALKALPPNNIYSDADRKTIFKGFRFYSENRVEGLGWDREKGVLLASLTDGGLQSVTFMLEGSKISSRCSSKHCMGEGKCEHVVCALLTLINLLKPNLFKINKEDLLRRERLVAALMNESGRKERPVASKSNVIPLSSRQTLRDNYLRMAKNREGPVYQIVIEGIKGRLKAYVEKNGERIGYADKKVSLPPELAYLVNFSRKEDMSVPLSIFLRKWGKDYPLSFHDGKTLRGVEWRDDIPCATWTEFDTSKSEIILRKGCSMGGDLSPVTLWGNFAFDFERTKMCYVKERRGWELWNMIRDAVLREPGFAERISESKDWTLRIPKDIFRGFQLSFEKSVGEKIPSAVFKIKGHDSAPSVSAASGYRIVVEKRDVHDREFFLTPQCLAGDFPFLPSRRVLTFVRNVEWGGVPASLRTRKRKPILYDMFFQSLSLKKNRKALDEALKKEINETTFTKPHFATLARRLIREAVADVKEEETQLLFTKRGWELVKVDRDKEVLLYHIPYKVFGEGLFERIVLDDGHDMAVEEEQFLRRLHTLNKWAQEQGIDVHLDGHPIETAAWEFVLDATEGTIDWFEIRPEIRCNGETIERELWEQALARKGVFYRNGAMQILDEKVMETLSAIARLTNGNGGLKKGVGREIVMVPRLRIIELCSLRRRGIAVKLNAQDEEIMSRLTTFERIENKPIPEHLKAELRHYQQEGYRWLSFLYEQRFGACLADDMGLGKTIQAITLLGAIKEGKVAALSGARGPSLIVVPPSLVFNWEQEIERFYPDLKIYVYRGKERSTDLGDYDVVLTSYGIIRRDIGKLKEVRFNVLIFDEAQTIKNILAGTTGAVRQLRGFFKIALTGTPVENHIGEYYSIVDLVLPGLLGDFREFQGQARQDLSAFIPEVTERTRPFVLRRTKERILKELPPKIERDVYLELTEKQKKFYNRTVDEVRTVINEAYRNKTSSQAKIIALTAIMKLRQICLTPQLLVSTQREITPKIEFLTNKLEELCSESHSSLVFSQFTSFLDVVEEELRGKGFTIFRLDGSTPAVRRKEIVEGFQDSQKPSVFLLSLKAGGQGLNLTRATYVFHLDPWWNPAVENQASDRSHRIGQKSKVIVTRLLMRHTVEEKMMALKQRKMSLYRALMDSPEKSAGRAITREDFNFLLGLNQ